MADSSTYCNVICMKWGQKYPASYVNRLRSMVKRNLRRPHRFVCLTDDQTGVDHDIEMFPLPDVGWDDEPGINQHGWRKIGLFAPKLGDLQGTALFLDLDIVIVGSLEPFFDQPGDILMIRDYRLIRVRGDYFVGNTSVFRFAIGAYPEAYERFRQGFTSIRAGVRNEQEFLSHHFRRLNVLKYWPRGLCVSFKHHCAGWGLRSYLATPKLPENATIVVFHGRPSPAEAVRGEGSKWYRRIQPTPWIYEYWG